MPVRMAGRLRHVVAIAGCGVLFGWVVGAPAISSASASAGPPRPRFTQTVDLAPIGGVVFVTAPGKRTARLSGAMQVALGATVDTRRGRVRVMSATSRPGVIHTAQFSEGQFELRQPRGEGGTLEVHLVGGDFGACKRGATDARYVPNQIHRQLTTSSGYPVHTSGNYGGGRSVGRGGRGRAADAAGPTIEWDTIDRCTGTTVLVSSGHVRTDGGKVPLHFMLNPDESAQYNCSARPPSYCAAVRSFDPTIEIHGTTVNDPYDVLTLLTRKPAGSYDLTINGATGGVTALTYPLSSPGPNGYRRSDVTCVPNQGPGDYQITWRIGTLSVPALTYVAQHGSSYNVQCPNSMPPGLGIPAGLSADVQQSNIDVHYTTNAGDPTDAVSDTSAGRVAQEAQSAFTFFTTGFGMPVNFGGSKIDIYIEGRLKTTEVIPLPPAPPPGDPAAAAIVLFPADAGNPLAVAGAVFGVLEDALGRIDGAGLERPAFSGSIQYWAAANWAAAAGVQTMQIAPLLYESLDCDLICGSAALNSAWRFYQHLNEAFPGIVPQLLSADAALIHAQPGPQMDNALQGVLASKGSSLAHELAQYVLEDLGQAWLAPWVGNGGLSNGVDRTGTVTAGERIFRTVRVRHLAARYLMVTVPLEFPCANDDLIVDITLPAGTGLAAADLAPGVTIETAGKFQTVPASSISATQQEVKVTLSSCSTTYVEVPVVNGTLVPSPLLTFMVTVDRRQGS
jgi:hypothetical protein